jgi:hypothetical protein
MLVHHIDPDGHGRDIMSARADFVFHPGTASVHGDFMACVMCWVA